MSIEFSVVVPTFRRPQALSEAIGSVLNQVGVTLEVIVVDDSPESSARAVVKSQADPRVTYLRNPHPTGGFPSVVRNLGFAAARGRFIHFLDDDDIVPAGHYAAVKSEFECHPNVGLVFGKIEPFGDHASENQLSRERLYFAEAARSALLCRRFGAWFAFAGRQLFDLPLLVCSAGVIRRDCVAEIQGFDPNIRLMEDADFFARAMRKCGVRFLDRITLHYRIGSPSLMHDPSPAATQVLEQREGRRRMQCKYRKEHGALEFYSLALFNRLLFGLKTRRGSD